MAGTINSLGLASGTLTNDLIDKLKNAETSSRINPITKAITNIQNQKKDLSTLILSITSVKSAAMDLGSESTYLKRTATSNSSDVSVSVSNGVAVQDMSIGVSQLAQNHVIQSKGFTSATSVISLTNETVNFKLNGSDYNINVTSGMTLEQFAQKINDSTNGDITATVLNTGGNTNPYRLILKAKDTGSANEIDMSSNTGSAATLINSIFVKPEIVGDSAASSGSISFGDGDIVINGVSIGALAPTVSGNSAKDNADAIAALINSKTDQTRVAASVDTNGKITLNNIDDGGIKVTTKNGAASASGLFATDQTDYTVDARSLQRPKDALFTYNGISMIRSSNKITDVVAGMTIQLNKVTTSNANISIKQDISDLPKMVDTFVTAFNSLNNKIKDLTKFDSTTKTAGSLQGVSDVSTVYGKLAALITKQNNKGVSLVDYGFSLDKNGSLSVDSIKLNQKISADPAALETLFRGSTDIKKASYTALKTASTTATTIAAGAIMINGVSIDSVTTVDGSAEDNAQKFMNAINKAYEATGVKAYTDGSGKILLENPSGGAIKINTTTAAAAASGLSASPTSDVAIQNVTVSMGSTTKKNGVFADINSLLGGMISGEKATLNLLDKSYQSQIDSKTSEKDKASEQIKTKYELLAKQFAQYDSMINKFQQSFKSIQMMIDAMNK